MHIAKGCKVLYTPLKNLSTSICQFRNSLTTKVKKNNGISTSSISSLLLHWLLVVAFKPEFSPTWYFPSQGTRYWYSMSPLCCLLLLFTWFDNVSTWSMKTFWVTVEVVETSRKSSLVINFQDRKKLTMMPTNAAQKRRKSKC